MLRWQQYYLVLGIVLSQTIVLSAESINPTSTFNSGLPFNCRERVYAKADSPIECARLTRKDLGLDKLNLKPEWQSPAAVQTSGGASYNTILNMWVPGSPSQGTVSGMTSSYNKQFDPDLLPGACRWDSQRSNILGSNEACMCPATEQSCKEEEECFWYEMPDSDVETAPTHACLNNAERFYYLLEKLLKKRGKNDFAIRIKYAGSPNNAILPKGMLGKLMMINMLSKMYKAPSYNSGFGQSSFGQSYNSGYGQSYNSGYGQSYSNGYGSSYNSGYGQPSNSGYGYGQTYSTGFGSAASGFGQQYSTSGWASPRPSS